MQCEKPTSVGLFVAYKLEQKLTILKYIGFTNTSIIYVTPPDSQSNTHPERNGADDVC